MDSAGLVWQVVGVPAILHLVPVNETTRRIVKENARVLGFTHADFEEE